MKGAFFLNNPQIKVIYPWKIWFNIFIKNILLLSHIKWYFVITNVMEEMVVFPAGGGKFSDISSSFEPESSQERPSGLCYNEFLLSRFAANVLLITKLMAMSPAYQGRLRPFCRSNFLGTGLKKNPILTLNETDSRHLRFWSISKSQKNLKLSGMDRMGTPDIW